MNMGQKYARPAATNPSVLKPAGFNGKTAGVALFSFSAVMLSGVGNFKNIAYFYRTITRIIST